MKKKVFSIVMVVCITAALCITAFAKSAIVRVGGHTIAFSDETVDSYVEVDQTAAGWNGTDGEMRWVLKYASTGHAIDTIYLTGADSDTLEPNSSGDDCSLYGYNNEDDLKLSVVYTYDIN